MSWDLCWICPKLRQRLFLRIPPRPQLPPRYSWWDQDVHSWHLPSGLAVSWAKSWWGLGASEDEMRKPRMTMLSTVVAPPSWELRVLGGRLEWLLWKLALVCYSDSLFIIVVQPRAQVCRELERARESGGGKTLNVDRFAGWHLGTIGGKHSLNPLHWED